MHTSKSSILSRFCEVRNDDVTRELYATDASLYKVRPQTVAFPKGAQEAAKVIQAAAEEGLEITPRGAGSGLAGGALGEGLVVDFARHNGHIANLDLEQMTVRVGAGVVLDQLNAFLKPHGVCFGPDVATSSRATVGGMIANNSSGARTPYYGTTADHVAGLEVVLCNGTIYQFFEGGSNPHRLLQVAHLATSGVEQEIRRRMPEGLLKRWPGYGIDRFLRQPWLGNIVAGSEGTLAGITAATLKVSRLPNQKGLGLLFFDSVADAMQATVELLALKPVAIEHIDRVLTDQTIGQIQFKAARDLLELDRDPVESILLVEFYEDVEEKLAALEVKRLGRRQKMLLGAAEMNLVWALRKAGVALLTGCKGSAKPTTCIEDATIRPERLPEFVRELRKLLKPLGVDACFYGHAASGLLHVRPVLDVHRREDLLKLRQISDSFSALVRQFRGSIASEHGVGICRTEYMREHLGEELLGAMREIKRAFDPGSRLNPGKIFDDGRYRIDTRLRREADTTLSLPFEPILKFASKDESFLANLDQCNGCGGCRKSTGVMCPTFQATGEESMSTRGRANLIRSALENPGTRGLAESEEILQVLKECLSCKACTTECPSNVNMSLLKAELLQARHDLLGLPLRERALSQVDLLGKLGTAEPRLANRILKSPAVRKILSELLGLAPERPLHAFAEERFDWWFRTRASATKQTGRKVILWDDCFVRYNEPEIGRAATRVLEAAGFDVELLEGRACCGRPAFSQGNLREAGRLGRQNFELLKSSGHAIIFLEPSCYSMFAEDYTELGLNGAEEVARRSFLFENFVEEEHVKNPRLLSFKALARKAAIHAHCHTKALGRAAAIPAILKRIPGIVPEMLATSCCGMAGSFGAVKETYELSKAVARPLVDLLQSQPADACILASGTSCRQQIEHLTPRKPLHTAELLAAALE